MEARPALHPPPLEVMRIELVMQGVRRWGWDDWDAGHGLRGWKGWEGRDVHGSGRGRAEQGCSQTRRVTARPGSGRSARLVSGRWAAGSDHSHNHSHSHLSSVDKHESRACRHPLQRRLTAAQVSQSAPASPGSLYWHALYPVVRLYGNTVAQRRPHACREAAALPAPSW